MDAIRSGLADQIRGLARLYDIDRGALEAALAHLFFDAYAEVIFGRDHLEIVVGDVGAPDRLIRAAHALGVPLNTVETFTDFSAAFPDRIGHLKIGFGPGENPPTMHCGAIVRWPEIFRFIEDRTEFAGAVDALRLTERRSGICHLVGFTTDPRTDVAIMKVYWLLDQIPSDMASPMLACARISEGRIRPENKEYLMGAHWDSARIDTRWNDIVEAARKEFTDTAYLCISHMRLGSEITETKLYVFAQDTRIAQGDEAWAWNLYYQEGLLYLRWSDLDHAIKSFTNALLFQPDNAHAFNNRGYCHIQRGDFARGFADCSQAVHLDPAISAANRDYAKSRLASAVSNERRPSQDIGVR